MVQTQMKIGPLAFKNGFVLSTRRPAGFTTAFHGIADVYRGADQPTIVVTVCGIQFDKHEMYDTIEDVPDSINGRMIRYCSNCRDKDW